MAEEIEVGKVSIFFAKPSVAAVEIASGTHGSAMPFARLTPTWLEVILESILA